MAHLAHLITSTTAQETFTLETRNNKITKTTLINHFNINDAFVVPTQGLLGGLWLLWNDQVELNVVDSSPNFILALCVNKQNLKKFGLVYLYGDPHH